MIQAQAMFDTPAHDAVREEIARQAANPAFTANLEPLERAKVKAFVEHPQSFMPCEALGKLRASEAGELTEARPVVR